MFVVQEQTQRMMTLVVVRHTSTSLRHSISRLQLLEQRVEVDTAERLFLMQEPERLPHQQPTVVEPNLGPEARTSCREGPLHGILFRAWEVRDAIAHGVPISELDGPLDESLGGFVEFV